MTVATKPHAFAGRSAAAERPALLRIVGVSKRFQKTEVLRSVSLDVREGEFITILGESGSGKTTLLRLIAGFEQADEGDIWMGEEKLNSLPPYRRRVNTVFQQYALFPHLTAFENVAYGLQVSGVAKNEIKERVEAALAMVKMGAFAAAKPARISGGQQQRVALARALVNRPRMLLLDEPLSALDANLRRQMQEELKGLQREIGITFLFVTHDQDEALSLSDRVAVLRSGKLEQVAFPEEIYMRPTTAYVARFIGQTNLLECAVTAGMARCSGLKWRCALPEGKAWFSLRPECVLTVGESRASDQGETVRFRGRVTNRTFQGAATLLNVECGELKLLVRRAGAADPAGEQEFCFDSSDLVPLPAEGA